MPIVVPSLSRRTNDTESETNFPILSAQTERRVVSFSFSFLFPFRTCFPTQGDIIAETPLFPRLEKLADL
eukprot:COSAG06_NODE_1208_length_10261_cov_5.380634_8_plen_70_part_00